MYAIIYTGDIFSYQLVKCRNWFSLEPTWEILLEFNTRPVNMICSYSAKLIFLQPAPHSLIKFTHTGQVFSDLQLLKLIDDEIFNIVLTDNTISSFLMATSPMSDILYMCDVQGIFSFSNLTNQVEFVASLKGSPLSISVATVNVTMQVEP